MVNRLTHGIKLLVALFVAIPYTAAAQAWPDKPVRIIVPQPPGGPSGVVGPVGWEPGKHR